VKRLGTAIKTIGASETRQEFCAHLQCAIAIGFPDPEVSTSGYLLCASPMRMKCPTNFSLSCGRRVDPRDKLKLVGFGYFSQSARLIGSIGFICLAVSDALMSAKFLASQLSKSVTTSPSSRAIASVRST